MRWWQINMRTVDTKAWSYEAEMEDLEETRQEEEEAFNNANNVRFLRTMGLKIVGRRDRRKKRH